MKNVRSTKVSLEIRKQGFTYPDKRYIVTEYDEIPGIPGSKHTDYLLVTKYTSSVGVSAGPESTIIISPHTIPMLIQELRRVYKQFEKEQ